MDRAKLRLRIERLRRRLYKSKDESRRLKVSQELDKLVNDFMKCEPSLWR